MFAVALFRQIGMQCLPIVKGSKKPFVSWANQTTCDNVPVKSFQNIAFRCGQMHPDGGFVVVLDVDNPRSHDASATVPAIFLFECFATNTLTIQTPGGGLHFYFRVPEPVDTIKFDWGELRSVGAYVLMPYSEVFVEKWQEVQGYKLLQGSLFRFWESIKWMPTNVIEAIQRHPATSMAPVSTVFTQSPALQGEASPPLPHQKQGQEIEIFSSEVEGISKILLEGVREAETLSSQVRGRNDAIFHLAYHLARRGLYPEHIHAICLLANKQFRPPLPDREVEVCVRSALKRAEGIKKSGNSNGNGHVPSEEAVARGRPISLRELLGMEFPQDVPLISDIVYKGYRTLVCSPSGVGKTTLVLRWAAEIARQGLRVVFWELEMNERTTQQYARWLQLTPDLPVHFVFTLDDIETADEADVFVVDSLRAYFANADVNKAELVETGLNSLWSMTKHRLKADSLIMIHHTNKLVYNAANIDIYNPAGFVQGSERFISWPDIVLYVVRPAESDEYNVHVLKTRAGEHKTWRTKVELAKKGAKVEIVHE